MDFCFAVPHREHSFKARRKHERGVNAGCRMKSRSIQPRNIMMFSGKKLLFIQQKRHKNFLTTTSNINANKSMIMELNNAKCF